MKKRICAFISAIVLMSTTFTSVNAIDTLGSQDLTVTYSVSPFASAYLDDYSISIGARDNCRIVITMDVNAVRTVDKLGCLMLVIDQKIDGVWSTYNVLFGIENPDFYMYNTSSYLGGYSFYGEEGVQYRATMTAYAQDSTGSDTGEEITSHVVTCRE